MRHPLALLILVLGISFLPLSARAQWQLDGVAVTTAADNEYFPQIVSDGAGGAIIAWLDDRDIDVNLYVQRINASGVGQWTADGVNICTGTRAKHPTMISDGAGGAIVAWLDCRDCGIGNSVGDIYAQRVNASGIPQWTGVFPPDACGIFLCRPRDGQVHPTIASDGAGGAIVAWQDSRWDVPLIFAQRVNASGVPQWTDQGIALCLIFNSTQHHPTIVSDDAGGAIVTWYDYRDFAGTSDIYAQRVNATGVPQWAANGVAVCTAAFSQQQYPTIVSDGGGGAIVTWLDARSSEFDIYSQRVTASGVPQWTADGVALLTTGSAVFDGSLFPFIPLIVPTLVSDGAGGAIVTWLDSRGGLASDDIYARRVGASGVPQWTADGVALCTAANIQSSPTIASDGAGGAIVTWYDRRSGATHDIYTQRVNAAGTPQWTFDGVALCTAANSQEYSTIVSDGAGGAIMTWQDYRSGTSDIYAQHVNASGEVPTAVAGPTRSPSLIVSSVYPNPFTGTSAIDIELTTPSAVRIEVFDVAGRRVRSMTFRDAVSQRVEFDGRDGANHLLPGGVYFYRVKAAGETITRKMVIVR